GGGAEGRAGGMTAMRLTLASNNAKKLVELQALFAPLGFELVTQGSLGIPEAEEPFHTFVENALAKARHAAEASGGAAIADDSGLGVDGLGGAPGVLSARYATLFMAPPAAAGGQPPGGAAAGFGAAVDLAPGGGPRDDEANNDTLLRELGDAADRRARFVS